MNPLAKLWAAGMAIYGRDWQQPMARELGPYSPAGPRASIDPRLVRHWVAGDRPVPAWVVDALPAILQCAADDMDERSVRLREMANSLRESVSSASV